MSHYCVSPAVYEPKKKACESAVIANFREWVMYNASRFAGFLAMVENKKCGGVFLMNFEVLKKLHATL